MQKRTFDIQPANGKLGILLPGLGAVSSTFIAGCVAVRRGLGEPFGSLTQMGTIRLGKRTEKKHPKIKDFIPLSSLEELEFLAWDPYPENCYQVARNNAILPHELLDQMKEELSAITPLPAVFDKTYVRNLDGPNVKKGATKFELASQLIEDIRRFKEERGLSRMVMIWTASTETYLERSLAHSSIENFEKAMVANDPSIAPSMLYAYAAIKSGIPFGNGAPNLCVDTPALQQLATLHRVPIAGKDLKTGQTLMKTIVAPGLKSRLLGIRGWFSSNILGNRDGQVLDDPDSFKTKEESKLSVLEHILEPEIYPSLYKDLYHKVRIIYDPRKVDNKESWYHIDIFGWLGGNMQIKIDFLCKDSILAAPIVLDLALFLDFSARCGMKGIQEWLSFYFKSPMVAEGLYPEHDLFIQLKKLKNTLRFIKGEELITHLGLEYYD